MPKAQRKRIANRPMIEVNSNGNPSAVVAGAKSDAMSGSGGPAFIAPIQPNALTKLIPNVQAMLNSMYAAPSPTSEPVTDPLTLAEQRCTASRELTLLHNDLKTGLGNGLINDPRHIEERTSQTMNIPEVRAFVPEAVTSVEESSLRCFVDMSEQKRIEELRQEADKTVNALLESEKNGVEPALFEQSLAAAKEVYIHSGGTPEEFQANLLGRFSEEAVVHAGTEYGDRLLSRAEDLAPDNSTLLSTITAYNNESIRKHEVEQIEAAIAEDGRIINQQNVMLEQAASASVSELQALRGQLVGREDAMRGILGDAYADTLTLLDEHIARQVKYGKGGDRVGGNHRKASKKRLDSLTEKFVNGEGSIRDIYDADLIPSHFKEALERFNSDPSDPTSPLNISWSIIEEDRKKAEEKKVIEKSSLLPPEQAVALPDEQYRADPKAPAAVEAAVMDNVPEGQLINYQNYDSIQSPEAKRMVNQKIAASSAQRIATQISPVTDPDDPFHPESLNNVASEDAEPFVSPMDLFKEEGEEPVPTQEDIYKQIHEAISNPRLAAECIRENAQEKLRESAEDLGFVDYLEATVTGIGHGVWYTAPELLLRATRSLAGNHSPVARKWADERLSAIIQERGDNPIDPRWQNDGLARGLYSGMDQFTASLAIAAPLILAGPKLATAGAGFKGVGFFSKLATTGAARLVGGSLAANTVHGLAQKDRFVEEALKLAQADNPNVTWDEINNDVFWHAALTGMATASSGMLTDVVAGKVANVLKIGKKPAEEIAGKLFSAIRNSAWSISTEVGEEVFEGMVANWAREMLDMPQESIVANITENFGALVVGGVASGVQNTVLAETSKPLPNVNPDAEVARILGEIDTQQYGGDFDSSEASEFFKSQVMEGKSASEAHAAALAAEAIATRVAEENGADRGGVLHEIVGGDLAGMVNAIRDADSSLSDITDNGIRFLWNRLTPETQQEVANAYSGSEVNLEILAKDLERYIRTGDLPTAMPDTSVPGAEGFSPVFDMMPDTAGDSARGFEAMKNVLADSIQALEGNSKIRPSRDAVDALGVALDRQAAIAPVVSRDQTTAESVLDKYKDTDLSDPKKLAEFMAESASAVKFNFLTEQAPASLTNAYEQVATAIRPFTELIQEKSNVRHDKKTLADARKRLDENPILKEFVDSYQSTLDSDAKVVEMGLALKTMHNHLDSINAAVMATGDETLAKQGLVYAGMVNAFDEIYRGTGTEQGRALRARRTALNEHDRNQMRKLQRLMRYQGRPKEALTWWQLYNAADTDAKIDKIMAVSLRTRWLDAFMEHYIGSMLTGIPTHIVNHMGNAVQTGNALLTRAMASRGMRPAEGGVITGEAKAMIDAIWLAQGQWSELWKDHRQHYGPGYKSWAEAKSDWYSKGHFKSDDAGMMRPAITGNNLGLSREHGVISGGLATAVDVIGKAIRVPFALLGGSDRYWKFVATKMEIAALAWRKSEGDINRYQELLNKPPKDHVKRAKRFAEELVFQTEPGKVGKALNDIRIAQPLVKFMSPFLKTPLNVLKETGKMTPGVARLFKYTCDALNSPDVATRQLAHTQLTLGTMFWTTAIGAAASGIITGPGPADFNERRKLEATGWQANSLRWGDTYIKLDRLDPLALILNGAALLVESSSTLSDEDVGDATLQLFGQCMRMFTDRSYLASMGELMEFLTNPEQAMPRMKRQLGRALVPYGAFGRTVNRYDPFMREEEGFWDSFKNTIPWQSYDLPIRRDYLGQPMMKPNYLGPKLISPIQVRTHKKDTVYDEVYRLQQAGSETPSIRQKTLVKNKTKIKMTAREYSEYLRIYGEEPLFNGMNLKTALEKQIQSQLYQSMEDDDKGKSLVTIANRYQREAKKRLIAQTPRIQKLLNLIPNGVEAIIQQKGD